MSETRKVSEIGQTLAFAKRGPFNRKELKNEETDVAAASETTMRVSRLWKELFEKWWNIYIYILSRFFLVGKIMPNISNREETFLANYFLRLSRCMLVHRERVISSSVRLHVPLRSLPSALLQLVLPVRLNTFRVAEAAERFLTFPLSHRSGVQNRRFSSAVTHRGGLKAARSFPAPSPLPPTHSRGTPYSGCFFVPTGTISNCR